MRLRYMIHIGRQAGRDRRKLQRRAPTVERRKYVRSDPGTSWEAEFRAARGVFGAEHALPRGSPWEEDGKEKKITKRNSRDGIKEGKESGIEDPVFNYFFPSFRQIRKFTAKYKTVGNMAVYFPGRFYLTFDTVHLRTCKCRNCRGIRETIYIRTRPRARVCGYFSFCLSKWFLDFVSRVISGCDISRNPVSCRRGKERREILMLQPCSESRFLFYTTDYFSVG